MNGPERGSLEQSLVVRVRCTSSLGLPESAYPDWKKRVSSNERAYSIGVRAPCSSLPPSPSSGHDLQISIRYMIESRRRRNSRSVCELTELALELASSSMLVIDALLTRLDLE